MGLTTKARFAVGSTWLGNTVAEA